MDANPIKAKIDQLIDNLCQLTDSAKITETFKAYMDSISRFYHYSYFNSMLIILTKPDATRVAGFHAWHKFNRFVRKGEHGIPILAPIIIKPKDQPEDQARLVGFKTAYVFDVSQTDGEPLPEAPEWRSPGKLESLHAKLLDFAASKDITVTVESLKNGAMGYSAGGKIVLDVTAGTKTLVHEIAHELLHKRNPIDSTRQRKEVEAESVAFVVCSFFGMPDLASPNYLALWEADPKVIKASLAAIQTTARLIIDYCNPNPTPEE